jgi:hypothetical protein
MSAAKAACVARAKAQLQVQLEAKNVEFNDTVNVSSDPTPQIFEFIWMRREITGIDPVPLSVSPGAGGVWCRGFADKRLITFLRVEDVEIIGTLETSLDPPHAGTITY